MSHPDDRLSTSDIASSRQHPDEPESPDTPDARPGEQAEASEGTDRSTTEAGTERAQAPTAERNLVDRADAERYQRAWDAIQAGFVDEPRTAVAEADELVAEVMRRLAETFDRERTELEAQWDRGEEVSTEDLRVSLQRYRSFFNRLLST